MTPAPDALSAQQALEILEKVQARTLLELWTTIMLCAGMAAVCLSQIFQIFGLRRFAAVFIGVYGYGMTWTPAKIAPPLGWFCIILSVAIILKESLRPAAPTPIKTKS